MQNVVLMHKRGAVVSRAELERLEPNEPRKLIALQHQVRQLWRQAAQLRAELRERQ